MKQSPNRYSTFPICSICSICSQLFISPQHHHPYSCVCNLHTVNWMVTVYDMYSTHSYNPNSKRLIWLCPSACQEVASLLSRSALSYPTAPSDDLAFGRRMQECELSNNLTLSRIRLPICPVCVGLTAFLPYFSPSPIPLPECSPSLPVCPHATRMRRRSDESGSHPARLPPLLLLLIFSPVSY